MARSFSDMHRDAAARIRMACASDCLLFFAFASSLLLFRFVGCPPARRGVPMTPRPLSRVGVVQTLGEETAANETAPSQVTRLWRFDESHEVVVVYHGGLLGVGITHGGGAVAVRSVRLIARKV